VSQARAQKLLAQVNEAVLYRAAELARQEWPDARQQVAEQLELVEKAREELARRSCRCAEPKLRVSRHRPDA
jgi:hypothetical protein